MDSLKATGYNGTFEDLPREPQCKFEVASFDQMDELYLLLFGIIFSISVFLVEIISFALNIFVKGNFVYY